MSGRAPCGRRRCLAAHLVGLIFLVDGAALGAAGPVNPVAPSSPTGPAPGLTWESTRLLTPEGEPVAAELGRLSVPERHDRATGAPVRLAFLRVRSTAAAPGPPIVYLSGGPGGSGTAAARGSLLPLFLALREVADVIALDQRGTGLSRPALICRESWSHPLDRLVGRDELLAAARARSESCAAMLREAGNDLGAYNTLESAQDLEALRRALGVPQLQLLGTSYGSQLALTALRSHPGSFARAVLVSAKGPQHGLRSPRAFDHQLAALELAAHGTFPDFRAQLTTLLQNLTDAPVTVEVPSPQAAGTLRLLVGPFDLQLMVGQALASRAEAERLPAQIAALARGDFQPLGRFALGLRRGWLGAAMPYLVECSSGLTDERRAMIRREAPQSPLGPAIDFPFPEICSGWRTPELGAPWRQPVHSEVPTLVIAGRDDVRTPLAEAHEILAGLAHGTLVTVEGFGHGEDFFAAPEVVATVRRFLAGQAVAPASLAFPPLAIQTEPPAGAPER